MNTGSQVKLRKVGGVYDISITSEGDIQTEDFLETTLLMILFCEQRADESEVSVAENRRGWIGNEDTPGFEIGSKLWLYSQSRLNTNTLNGVKTAVENGMQQLIVDGLATNVLVTTAIKNGKIELKIVISRVDGEIETRYFTLWNNTGVL